MGVSRLWYFDNLDTHMVLNRIYYCILVSENGIGILIGYTGI